MLFALGAASSAIDALKALTSSKSSSAQSTGVSQNATSPFDLLPATPASAGSGARFRRRRLFAISPQTMSALLDAQSQSSSGVDDIGVHEPLRRAEGPVLADRRRRRRQDQQVGIRKRARRRRHQPRAGRQRLRQARQERRRFGQPRGTGVGAEGRQGRASSSSRRRANGSGDASDDGGSTPIRCCRRLRVLPARPSPTATVRRRRR